jgi:uncharacterized protein YkwD
VKRATQFLFGLVTAIAFIVSMFAVSLHRGTVPVASAMTPSDDHAQIRAAAQILRSDSIHPVASRHRARTTLRAASRRRTVVHRTVTVRRAPVVTSVSASSAASQMASMVNNVRASHGLRTLRWNNALASGSESHSRDMASQGRIYHSSQSQIWHNVDSGCSSCTDAGEVVGVGKSVRQVFDAFMASSEHRTVILDPAFRYFGVGIVYSRGSYWVTIQFAG